MNQCEQQNPAHTRSDHIPTEIAREELACLLSIRLANQHEHRRCERRFKSLVAIHVHDSHTIEENVEQRLDEEAELTRKEREDEADGVDIEKQLGHREFVRLSPAIPQIIRHDFELGTEIAEQEHKEEEGAVFLNGRKQPAYPLEYVHVLKHNNLSH